MNGIHIECECPEEGHRYTCPCALMLDAGNVLEALQDTHSALDCDYRNLSQTRHNEIYLLLSNYKEILNG